MERIEDKEKKFNIKEGGGTTVEIKERN